jgi:hypothetical protein
LNERRGKRKRERERPLSLHARRRRRKQANLLTSNECRSVGTTNCRVALPLGARAQHGEESSLRGGGGGGKEEDERRRKVYSKLT